MLDAILLGILQGLTEFLPISSSAHLVLGEHFLGLLKGQRHDILLEVVLHLGTLLAVFVAFRRDLMDLAKSLLPVGSPPSGGDSRRRQHRLLLAMVLATIPAAIVGLSLKDPVTALFAEPRLVAMLLLVTGVILLIGDRLRRGERDAEDTSPVRAVGIGLAQALAILPGISRSGATIVAGIAMGLRPVEAARFSFLISIPAVAGAALLEALPIFTGEVALSVPPGVLLAGFLSAAVAGYLSLRWLLIAVRRRSLSLFAIYCFLVGTLALLFGGLA